MWLASSLYDKCINPITVCVNKPSLVRQYHLAFGGSYETSLSCKSWGKRLKHIALHNKGITLQTTRKIGTQLKSGCACQCVSVCGRERRRKVWVSAHCSLQLSYQDADPAILHRSRHRLKHYTQEHCDKLPSLCCVCLYMNNMRGTAMEALVCSLTKVHSVS